MKTSSFSTPVEGLFDLECCQVEVIILVANEIGTASNSASLRLQSCLGQTVEK